MKAGRWWATGGAVLAVVVALATDRSDRPVPVRPHHLRVVWSTDPAHAATVLWSSAADGPAHLDLAPTTGSTVGVAVQCRVAPYAGGDRFVHRCELSGLTASTRYDFVASTAGSAASPHWFRSGPSSGEPFRLLFGGDSRSDRVMRRHMNRRMADLAAEDPGIIGFAHGGDYVGDGRRWRHWQGWLDDLDATVSPRLLPIIPCRGNHEARGPLYGQVFGEPGGAAGYYRVRVGDLSLLTLNTEISMAGDQRDWLAATLGPERKAARWLVVQYHRAAFPAVKSPSGARLEWVPLFERHDVDLIFESDGHALKRTVPIRAEQQDSRGVVYVGEGGLGVVQRTPRQRWYLQNGGMAASAYHVMVLSVTPGRLAYRAVGADGAELDRWQRSVRRAPEPNVGSAREAP